MAVHITTTRDPDRNVNIGKPWLRWLINTINGYRRQMNVQILMKYNEWYERILDQFPLEALVVRFDTKVLSLKGSDPLYGRSFVTHRFRGVCRAGAG
jgi:hypothetical protein